MPSISHLRRLGDRRTTELMRHAADDLSRRIREGRIDPAEARRRAADLRFQARLLLPERMDTYDRIYQARFERLIAQFLGGG